MHIGQPEIQQVVEVIWTTVLGLETAPHDGEPPEGTEGFLKGSARISGDWEGIVTLACPEALARQAAAIMFETPEGTVTPDLLRDALGELTNMTAGNLKALVPGFCCLSLPTVEDGPDCPTATPDTELPARVTFGCQGQYFLVTVSETITLPALQAVSSVSPSLEAGATGA